MEENHDEVKDLYYQVTWGWLPEQVRCKSRTVSLLLDTLNKLAASGEIVEVYREQVVSDALVGRVLHGGVKNLGDILDVFHSWAETQGRA